MEPYRRRWLHPGGTGALPGCFPETAPPCQGPKVRIHLPPGGSPLRTWTADDSGVGRKDRLQGLAPAEPDGEIAGLVGQSTQELRRVWRTLHHTGPPMGLSRDLIIRGLADKLQQRAHGGPSRALQRRLRILATNFEKDARSFDPDIVPKTRRDLGAAVARTDPYRLHPRGQRREPGSRSFKTC